MAKTATPQKKDSTPRSFVENLESSCRIIKESITAGVNKEGRVRTECDKAEREQKGVDL